MRRRTFGNRGLDTMLTSSVDLVYFALSGLTIMGPDFPQGVALGFIKVAPSGRQRCTPILPLKYGHTMINCIHPEMMKMFFGLSAPLRLCVSCSPIPQRRNSQGREPQCSVPPTRTQAIGLSRRVSSQNSRPVLGQLQRRPEPETTQRTQRWRRTAISLPVTVAARPERTSGCGGCGNR